MVNTNNGLPGKTVDLIQDYTQNVYRYHLVRSENYLEAQNLTVQTIRTALKWLGIYHSRPSGIKTWIMEIARYEQYFGRRHTIHRDLPETVDRDRDTEMIPSSSVDDISTEQDEIILRDQVRQLAGAWKRYSRDRVDALALHFFGGLSVAETGEVLGKSETDVRALISKETAFESQFQDLAASLHPSQKFLSWLAHEVRQGEAGGGFAPSKAGRWWGADSWKLGFKFRTLFSSSSRVMQAGLLVAVLALGFYIIQRQSVITPPQPQSAASIASNPLPTPKIQEASLVLNALVPPDGTVCQTWKANLEALVSNSFTVSSAAFGDPTGDNPGYSGTGCELETTVTGPGQNNAVKTVGDVAQFFVNNGFGQGPGFDNLPGLPTSAFFPANCTGFGRVYQNSDLYVFLSAGYCPANGSQPTPAAGAGNTVAVRPVRGYILRFILATSSVETRLNHFFSAWSSGSNTILGYFDFTALSQYPNVQALDRMLGIARSPTKTITFNWKPVENTGTDLRVEALALETDSQTPSATGFQPTFQMLLSQKLGWEIGNVSKSVLSSATSDQAVVADKNGQISLLALSDGIRTPVTQSGFYTPGSDHTARFPSQVSPDGRWLAWVQPGNGSRAGTWLLSLDAQETAIQISNQELNLAWSPDSEKIAYFDPAHLQSLKILTVFTGETTTLTEINGTPLNLAWSPAGDLIGFSNFDVSIEFGAGQTAGTTEHITIALVSVASGKTQILASISGSEPFFSPMDLSWTSDGQELWSGFVGVAFNVRDGSIHKLVSQPLAGELANQQSDLLRQGLYDQPLINPPSVVVSPDWENLAQVYTTANTSSDYLTILPVSAGPGQNHCCLEYLGNITAFAWTGDGKSLVVYNGVDGVGDLLLVDPASGERQTAATGVYYFGLLSRYKQGGLKLAPTVDNSQFLVPNASQVSQPVNSTVLGISLVIPPDWHVWQPDKDFTTGSIVLSNHIFANPFGFTALPTGGLYISIKKIPMLAGETAKTWYQKIMSLNQQDPIYEPITVAGIQGYRSIHQPALGSPEEILLPVGKSEIIIDKYPFDILMDPTFLQILGTMTVKDQ